MKTHSCIFNPNGADVTNLLRHDGNRNRASGEARNQTRGLSSEGPMSSRLQGKRRMKSPKMKQFYTVPVSGFKVEKLTQEMKTETF